MTRRRHHCRNCGFVFCGECAWRMTTVPRRSINTEVRVCETCYDGIVEDKRREFGAQETQSSNGNAPSADTRSPHNPPPNGFPTSTPVDVKQEAPSKTDTLEAELKRIKAAVPFIPVPEAGDVDLSDCVVQDWECALDLQLPAGGTVALPFPQGDGCDFGQALQGNRDVVRPRIDEITHALAACQHLRVPRD